LKSYAYVPEVFLKKGEKGEGAGLESRIGGANALTVTKNWCGGIGGPVAAERGSIDFRTLGQRNTAICHTSPGSVLFRGSGEIGGREGGQDQKGPRFLEKIDGHRWEKADKETTPIGIPWRTIIRESRLPENWEKKKMMRKWQSEGGDHLATEAEQCKPDDGDLESRGFQAREAWSPISSGDPKFITACQSLTAERAQRGGYRFPLHGIQRFFQKEGWWVCGRCAATKLDVKVVFLGGGG